MPRRHCVLLVPALACLAGAALSTVPLRADDAQATLDQAITALGGEEKLSAVKAFSSKSKGTLTLGGNPNEFTNETTVEGLDHALREFEGNFNGNAVKGVTVVNGDKGWRMFGGNTAELDEEGLKLEKQRIVREVVPTLLVQLKKEPFKVEADKDKDVDGKPAAGLKVTEPDGGSFTLWIDKTSHLPVAMTGMAKGFNGAEFEQETTYAAYKEFDGIKKATKITASRNGEKFLDDEITEFKVLDMVEKGTFDEPN